MRVVIALALAASAPAAADVLVPERARQLSDHGRALYDAGNYAGAIAAYDEAYALAPRPGLLFWPWVFLGLLMQIGATATMLAAMNDRSFVVTIAYTKTEPMQVALFGFLLLGDKVTLLLAAAIVIATAGVVVMSLKRGAVESAKEASARREADFEEELRATES